MVPDPSGITRYLYTMKESTLVYCSYSHTIRQMPQNYWVCSVIDRNNLDWSDHDACTADIDRKEVLRKWKANEIQIHEGNPFSKLTRFVKEMKQYDPWNQVGTENIKAAARLFQEMDKAEKEGAWRAHNFLMSKELAVTTVENFAGKMTDVLKW